MPPAKKASPPDASVLMTGIVFGECPRWHDRRLWFADWAAETLYAVDPQGRSEAVARVASFPFSFDWLPDGRLIVVNARENRLMRREADGAFVTHADLAGLSNFGCNEIVVDGRGNVYLNNINFAFPGGAFAPGFVALLKPDGTLRKVAEDVAFPNGMAVTPDNRTLILAESYGKRLTAFDIAADGGLGNRRLWADLGEDYPDGICLDAEGAVWYADVPNRHCVRVREGGGKLQTIALDRGCFACMLGGDDRQTLFMVANQWGGPDAMAGGEPTGQILTARAPAPAAGWP
jgi:sugar lactone lactonase YvrE